MQTFLAKKFSFFSFPNKQYTIAVAEQSHRWFESVNEWEWIKRINFYCSHYRIFNQVVISIYLMICFCLKRANYFFLFFYQKLPQSCALSIVTLQENSFHGWIVDRISTDTGLYQHDNLEEKRRTMSVRVWRKKTFPKFWESEDKR